jgi:predicted transcriptional regulator
MMATLSIRLDADFVHQASAFARAQSRTTPKQIEHWAKIGRIMEDNPDLSYEFVSQLLVAQAEKEAGLMELFHFD